MSRAMSLLVLILANTNLLAQEIRLNPPHFALLINEAVVKELQLSDQQKKDIKEVLGDMIQELDGQKRIVIQGGADIDTLEADCKKVLNEKQVKRLQEAWVQINGAMVVTDEKIAKELKITAEQTTKATSAIQKMNESMREIFMAGGDRKEVSARAKQLRADTRKTIEGLLTAEQKTKLTTLEGVKIAGLIKP